DHRRHFDRRRLQQLDRPPQAQRARDPPQRSLPLLARSSRCAPGETAGADPAGNQPCRQNQNAGEPDRDDLSEMCVGDRNEIECGRGRLARGIVNYSNSWYSCRCRAEIRRYTWLVRAVRRGDAEGNEKQEGTAGGEVTRIRALSM